MDFSVCLFSALSRLLDQHLKPSREKVRAAQEQEAADLIYSYFSSSLRHWMMSWMTGSSSFRRDAARLALFSQS